MKQGFDLRNFDIIGDVHGCFDELLMLLIKAGYKVEGKKVIPLKDRKIIFVGDLVDRGDKIKEVLDLAMDLVSNDVAYSVMGNHDNKLLRYLKGNNVKIINGLEDSVEQLKDQSNEYKNKLINLFEGFPTHLILDKGKLAVAHAGIKEEDIGRDSKKVRTFTLYGDITGQSDEEGYPIRRDWALHYKGRSLIVYGHTPYFEIKAYNNTINIDTGCVFGNKLTLLRYPELEIFQVDAKKTYYQNKRMK